MSGYTRIANDIDAEAEAALREVEEEELREAETKEREYEEAKKRRDQEQAAKEKGDDVLEEYRKADAKALAALEEAASRKRERDEAEDVEVDEEEEGGDNKKIATDSEPVTVA